MDYISKDPEILSYIEKKIINKKMNTIKKNLINIKTSSTLAINETSEKLQKQGKEIFKFGLGQSPFPVPSSLVNELKKRAHEKNYLNVSGLLELRKQIAKYHTKKNKNKYHLDNVIIGPGSKELIFQTQLVLDGDLLLPRPSWVSYEPQAKILQKKIHWINANAESNWHITAKELDSICKKNKNKKKLLILNSPNNPCGSAIDAKNMSKLANILEDKNITILSDEIYSQFLYEGSHSSISNYKNLNLKTIILDGFSKSYSMTGWRIGYGIFPKELVDPITKLVTNSNSCTASFTQIAAIEALKGSQESVNKMVSEFKSRRDLIVDGLNNIKNISCPNPSGAFYVFPNITKTGLSSELFASKLLEENGVATLSGESFGEEGKGYIRISFANSKANILEALNRIEDFVNKL